MESKRRITLVRRVGLLTGGLLVGVLAAGAAVCVWLALEYHWFSSDVAKSRARLPATLQSSLAPAKNVLNQPQVTLVRYRNGTSTGGAVLFSTNPQTRVVSFLTIPPVSTLDGREFRRYSTPQLIDALKQRAGITVRHVAIIDLTNVGALVDGIGGIHVDNPAAFDVTLAGGRTWFFAKGPLQLDGAHAVAYLRRGILRGNALGQAGVIVLKGIVHRVLEPSSVGSLQTTGTALASSTATDLTDADVIGLIYLRLEGGTGMECGFPPRQELTSSSGTATVQAFLGRNASPNERGGVHGTADCEQGVPAAEGRRQTRAALRLGRVPGGGGADAGADARGGVGADPAQSAAAGRRGFGGTAGRGGGSGIPAAA